MSGVSEFLCAPRTGVLHLSAVAQQMVVEAVSAREPLRADWAAERFDARVAAVVSAQTAAGSETLRTDLARAATLR